jgi:pimeloyl-ACP methyl ester carboxylesterase
MAIDVFVSYASEDRETVREIVAGLESAGLEVWWDRAIGAGASFDREIEQALDAAGCVVVVWTANSVDSDWVRAEAYEGLNRGVLLPVSVGAVRPPLAFRQMQTIDASNGHQVLLDAVRQILPESRAKTDHAPKIRYATTSDNVKIAYVLQGEGPPLVRSLSWITSCSLELDDRCQLTHDLRSQFRLLTYDGRGIGLSDAGAFPWTLEQRLSDLDAVIETSGIGKPFALMAISEGARTAIAYAAEHPDRVSHLVLHGPVMPAEKPAPDALERSRWFVEFLRQHWGTRLPIARRMICAVWSQSATEEEQTAYMQQMRESMSRDVAARYIETLIKQNNDAEESKRLWDLAARVRTPTLIVHSIRDPLVPYEGAQRLSKAMPNAELLPLTIPDHGTGLSKELDRIQARETQRFVLG